MITINIELKPKNKIKEFFQNVHNTLEDIIFSVAIHLPEPFIPSFLMDWLERYTTKRTQELQQEIIRERWKQVYLEKAINEIHSRQEKNSSD